MAKLSNEEEQALSKLAETISGELVKRNVPMFKVKPTVYVVIGGDGLYISLADENEQVTKICLTTKKEIRSFGFFMQRFMLEDYLNKGESWIEIFAKEKVTEFLEATREENAYSRNLQRADSLIKDGYYFAAQVVLVSAFEVACRDMFFRNNSYWFIALTSPHEELYKKFGVELHGPLEEDAKKYRTQVGIGFTRYGLDESSYDKVRRWESVILNDKILHICRQLGVYEEYSQKLFGNSFQEIGHYEILKSVLQKSRKRPMDFQILDGTGGVKWSFRRFFAVDLEKLSDEMKILKECFQKRHQIIHGDVDDTEITKDNALEFHAAVRKVISYIHDEIMTWNWVLD
jgi:hypothetical protein